MLNPRTGPTAKTAAPARATSIRGRTAAAQGTSGTRGRQTAQRGPNRSGIRGHRSTPDDSKRASRMTPAR
jgi:hypothetical protein